MMLNATEVAALLERLQRIVTIKHGAEAGDEISYPFPERIVALGDSGDGLGWPRMAVSGHRYVGGCPATTRCRWTSSFTGFTRCATRASRRAPAAAVPEPLRPGARALHRNHERRERRVLCRDARQGRLVGGADALLRWGEEVAATAACSPASWVPSSWSCGYCRASCTVSSSSCRAPAGPARDRCRQNTQARATVAKLDAAAASAARLRFRVSGTLMQFGWMLTVLANAPMLFAVAGGPQVRDGVQFVVGSFLYYVSACPWGIGLMMLSLRPIDSRPIFGLCVFLVLFSLLMLFMMVFIATNRDWNGDFTPLAVILASVGIFLIIALFIIPALNIRAGVLARAVRTEDGAAPAATAPVGRLPLHDEHHGKPIPRLDVRPGVHGLRDRHHLRQIWSGSRDVGFHVGLHLLLPVRAHHDAGGARQMVRALGSIGKSDDKEQEAASVAALINGRRPPRRSPPPANTSAHGPSSV